MRMRTEKSDRDYVPPEKVLSPRVAGISNMEVLYDGGPSDADNDDYRWSAAMFDWYGNPVIGLRWNGHSEGMAGNPQSRGMPTWFIVPDEIADVIKEEINRRSLEWPRKWSDEVLSESTS
jgi:hypothetical protein